MADSEEKMQKAIHSLTDTFAAIRTGRASAALFDKVRVDCYGQKSPLNQVATIAIPEARAVVIQPFDKSLYRARAIFFRTGLSVRHSRRIRNRSERVFVEDGAHDLRHAFAARKKRGTRRCA